MTRKPAFCFVLANGILICSITCDSYVAIKAGAAQRDLTSLVGLDIQHYYRMSVGVHDTLFARC